MLEMRYKDDKGCLLPKTDVDTLMDLISQDKKVKRGALTLILVRGIGQAFIEKNVDAGRVHAFLTDKLK